MEVIKKYSEICLASSDQKRNNERGSRIGRETCSEQRIVGT